MPRPDAASQAVLDLFRSWPQRSTEAELLDTNGHDPKELGQNLRDIRRVNQRLGGTSTVLRHLPRLLDAVPATKPATVLDLATGSGDIPIAIARWARTYGRSVSIVASDNSSSILQLARAQTLAYPEITLLRCDARAVPIPDKQFDIVLCSLSLHHFDPDDAVLVLREMDRLSQTGFILNDLRRGRLGYLAAWAAAHVTTRNRLTRNDAPLSMRRAYTPAELSALLECAGIVNASISNHLWFRMAAVKPGAGHGT
jgi:SAM-dependent methyltransferase